MSVSVVVGRHCLTAGNAGELELMLREKDQALHAMQVQAGHTPSPASSLHTLLSSDGKPSDVGIGQPFHAIPKYMTGNTSPTNGEAYGSFAGPSSGPSTLEYGHLRHGSTMNGANGGPSLMHGNVATSHSSASPSILTQPAASPPSIDDFNVDIRTWPPNLPSPEITRHL